MTLSTEDSGLTRRGFVRAAAGAACALGGASAVLGDGPTNAQDKPAAPAPAPAPAKPLPPAADRPKIGCVSWCFHSFTGGVDPTEAIDTMGDLGFEGTDLILTAREDVQGFWTQMKIDSLRARLEKHHLAPDWGAFLADFCHHWPTHEEHTYVDFIRSGTVGQGALRSGDRRWRRLTELRAGSAKSVFHFDVQGTVAKSTHAGIPWLRFLRDRLGNRVHFWPFDGWLPVEGVSVVAEAYPAIYRDDVDLPPGTPDQLDAFAIAAWMQNADRSDALDRHFQPTLTPSEQTMAQIEGWILGVPGQAMEGGRVAARSLALSKKHARDFLVQQLRLELVTDPTPIHGVDCSTMDVYRVIEDGRIGSSRYVGVSKATGKVRDLGYLGD